MGHSARVSSVVMMTEIEQSQDSQVRAIKRCRLVLWGLWRERLSPGFAGPPRLVRIRCRGKFRISFDRNALELVLCHGNTCTQSPALAVDSFRVLHPSSGLSLRVLDEPIVNGSD